jgi:hypothetical protein
VCAAVQYAVAMHCPSFMQLVGQEPLAHRYGSQTVPEFAVQAPPPLHSCPSAMLPLAEHMLVPHEVPAG